MDWRDLRVGGEEFSVVRAGGHVDAVEWTDCPPDDFVVDRGVICASVPLGSPAVCLVTGACPGQQGGKPGIEFFAERRWLSGAHDPRAPNRRFGCAVLPLTGFALARRGLSEAHP
jgi:hypothetical protein